MASNRVKRRCPFCGMVKSDYSDEENTMIAVADTSPVTRYHMLVIPKRHCETYFDLTRQERCDADALIERLRRQILEKDPSVTGFNIGINVGVSAGQTVFHTHIHLIPRRDKDTPHPRGGIRGVIPGKMDY